MAATSAADLSAGWPASPASADFLPPQDEARAFWRMRLQTARTLARQAFAEARFRLSLIALLSLTLWLGLYWLFADGFAFLHATIQDDATYDRTIGTVLGTFLAALMVMLVFSSGIILYGGLFRSREVELLLSLPARTERVFLHKFQEAVLLSSWGFVLLGSPMLLAYGTESAAPWYFYAMLLPFIVSFLYIPSAFGAMLCVVITHRLPGKRLHVFWLSVVGLVAGAAWVAWSLATERVSNLLTPDWFREVIDRLQFTQGRLLPTWWLSTGLLEAARDEWAEAVKFLALLIANALFCRQLAIWLGGRLLRPAYSALSGRSLRRRTARPAWIDRAALAATAWLPLPMRLLVVKDLRLFRRDPLQWLQFLIFFGLLALYFLNIRQFSYEIPYAAWVNMVGFLNLSVVGLLMSTFTTRFIFPMISLEGRRFWLLGLLPLKRDTILWSKFLFAAGGSIVPCSLLILLSDLMLRVDPLILVSHQVTCLILCVGLSGIAVGLGARLPNLREQSPSRIAAGFGGTLNLVVSTLFIVAVVLLTALPFHFYLVSRTGPLAQLWARFGDRQWWIGTWLVAGSAASVALGAAATAIPLWIGFRAFRRIEF
jgi:ABC-2 type transport system permease protein